jgi:enoyl-CoA hydratase/carnithine racemase
MTDILFTRDGHVATITLNRPEVLNAVRRSMFQRLLSLMDDVAGDEGIRVVVLTGAGRSFSAGIDLDEVGRLFDGSMSKEDAREELAEMQELTRRMVRLRKPVIAAINGFAIGVGAELAIASDIRVASRTASFSFAEVKRGLSETNGVMHRLPRLIGLGRAAEAMLTGATIDAEAALGMGLVTRLFPPETLLAGAMELARQIAANAPISVGIIKRMVNMSGDHDLEAMMAFETEGMLECLASEDLREGIKAFSERRPPIYRGR